MGSVLILLLLFYQRFGCCYGRLFFSHECCLCGHTEQSSGGFRRSGGLCRYKFKMKFFFGLVPAMGAEPVTAGVENQKYCIY